MTEHSKVVNPPTDLLEWVWAYRQALALLDRFDAEGLDCAASCKADWPETSWRRFLDTYGLKRGKHAELRHRGADIFRALVPIFRPPLRPTGTLRQLQERWQLGVDLIGRLCTRKNKNGGDPTLWSMASKLLWFYQPELMTMYDEYTRKGLAAARREGLAAPNRGAQPQKDYLQYFEQLFENKRPEIDTAAKFSDRTYPYRRRVLAQWLWLKGSGEKADCLAAFRLSLDKAPISSHDFNKVAQLSCEEHGAETPALKNEILAISKRCAALPDHDLRSAEEILGYDEHGLPK
jgi:hypothetical protein